MKPQESFSARTPSDGAAKRAGDEERVLSQQLAGLDRLVEVGHRIIAAIALHMASLTGPARWDRLFELEDVYSRIEWALRLLVRLQLKLARDASRFDRGQDDEPAEKPDRPETERAESLESESGDRFDFDGFGRILKRPPEEVIAIIRRELGATPEWRDWVEAAWADEERAGEATPVGTRVSDAPVVETLQRPRWRRTSRSRLARSRGQRRAGHAGPS